MKAALIMVTLVAFQVIFLKHQYHSRKSCKRFMLKSKIDWRSYKDFFPWLCNKSTKGWNKIFLVLVLVFTSNMSFGQMGDIFVMINVYVTAESWVLGIGLNVYWIELKSDTNEFGFAIRDRVKLLFSPSYYPHQPTG